MYVVNMSYQLLEKKVKKQDAINHFGGVKPLADALGVWPAAVYKWGDDVPEMVAYKLHVITGGALKIEAQEGIKANG